MVVVRREAEPPISSPPDRLAEEHIQTVLQLEKGRDQALPRKRAKPGEKIITKGEKGREVYILLWGQVEVITGVGQPPITLSGRGIFFGEIAALFSGVKRTADVVAAGDDEVLTIEVSHEELASWNGAAGALGKTHEIITDVARNRIRQMSGAQLQEAGFPWASSPFGS